MFRIGPVVKSLNVSLAAVLVASLLLVPVRPAQAQTGLSTSKTSTPNPATIGEPVTSTITITNNSATQRVGLRDFLPPDVTFVSATPSQGFCGLNSTDSTAVVDCTLGVVPSGGSVTVTVVVTPMVTGTITNVAVAQAEFAPATPANTASTTTTVLGPEIPPSSEDDINTHVVRPGDTLSGLAERFGSSVEDIAHGNSIENPALIFPGQSLVIPVTKT